MTNNGEVKKGKRHSWGQIGCSSLIVLFVLLLVIPDCGGSRAVGRAQLLGATSNARQIYFAAESLAIEEVGDKNGPGGFPADVGVKSGMEYIAYLLKRGAIKEEDLKIFCKPGRAKNSFKDLRAEDIVYRFANVSAKDVGDTAFIVSRNVVEGPSDEGYLKKGYIVIHRGGDGLSQAKMPPDPKLIGPLPPREPKFLEP